MISLFPPDLCAPWFQCATKTAEPSFVDAVEPCPAPEGELFYVGTRLVGETLYMFYRRAFVPAHGPVEFWAQVRKDDPPEAA